MVSTSSLSRSFVALSDTLAVDFDLESFLQALCAHAVQTVGTGAAAVVFVDPRSGEASVAAASDIRMGELARLELADGGGVSGRAVATGVAAQGSIASCALRWPTFAARAVTEGYSHFCVIPLSHGGECIGVISVLSTGPEVVTAEDFELLQALVAVATIALLQRRSFNRTTDLVSQLQTALTSRIIIEQAKGMLAEFYRVPVDDAFVLLRGYARRRNLKLTQLCHELVSRQVPLELLAPRTEAV